VEKLFIVAKLLKMSQYCFIIKPAAKTLVRKMSALYPGLNKTTMKLMQDVQ